MSSKPASLLAAYWSVPSLSPDAVRYERLRSRLCEVIGGADVPINLIGVIIALPVLENIKEPLSPAGRDNLLRLTVRAHAKALDEFSQWYSPGQIDAGMEALAAWIVLLAEPKEQRRARPKAALRDLFARKMLFRNLLENLVLAESLTADMAGDARDDEIARILGSGGRQ